MAEEVLAALVGGDETEAARVPAARDARLAVASGRGSAVAGVPRGRARSRAGPARGAAAAAVVAILGGAAAAAVVGGGRVAGGRVVVTGAVGGAHTCGEVPYDLTINPKRREKAAAT